MIKLPTTIFISDTRRVVTSAPIIGRSGNFASLVLGLSLAILATSSYAAPNDDFGRLFSHPNERSHLDLLRQNQKLKVLTVPSAAQQEIAPPEETTSEPEPIVLQGYVKRGDGQKSTVWINNQAVQEDSAVDNIKVGRLKRQGNSNKNAKGSTSNLDVDISADGKHVRLKPGQTYEPVGSPLKKNKEEKSGKAADSVNTGDETQP